MKLPNETVTNPNFSIVVPGPCNASCDFCFWRKNNCRNISSDYIKKLEHVLISLPEQFYQISFTGGEPTLSPYFGRIIELIDTKRYPHTVLTTNGSKLKENVDLIKGVVKHVNISRHATHDQLNQQIFGTTDVPNAKSLERLCESLNTVGIDVTFNAVLDKGFKSKEDITEYIQFAKSCGASGVSFREKHGTLESSKLEKEFDYLKKTETSCPVCRTVKHLLIGTSVNWKYSMEEPSQIMPNIYELIFHPNGILSEDWDGKKSIETGFISREEPMLNEERLSLPITLDLPKAFDEIPNNDKLDLLYQGFGKLVTVVKEVINVQEEYKKFDLMAKEVHQLTKLLRQNPIILERKRNIESIQTRGRREERGGSCSGSGSCHSSSC
jgi:pyruvate-formate lyase-activating enzyme